MAQSATRSPSPAPAPPTASTPGPRAAALQKLYSDAIAHILTKGCSQANFTACFPTIAAQVPQSLTALHADFTEKLHQSMERNFEDILQSRDVIKGLNELDELVEDARKRKQEAIATGSGEPALPCVKSIGDSQLLVMTDSLVRV